MKNLILKAVTVLAALALVVSACCLGSVSSVPHVAFLVSGAWIMLFMYANWDRLVRWEP